MSSCSSTVHTLDLCYCGLPRVLKTSWIDNNPGRRFWSCRMYLKNERSGCGYYLWHDPPIGGRYQNIIPGLLRKIDKLEDEIKALKKKQKMTICILVGTNLWLCTCYYCCSDMVIDAFCGDIF
ncbi:hypothetical protein DCAR_0933246 [Daucus carota subsp. sativus]|uniref:GRF-type domain-containing protein n=1 Tax=Daucus carota subsp. sativus TaxID=79200 RepID=A0AAF0XTJ0_DAUCS|nr:hypothetical protein DCAR_0933246 [Daucus carota subsp. sativus]